MSDGPGNSDEPGSFDDPDWVDQMLERALDSATEEPDEPAAVAPEAPLAAPPPSQPPAAPSEPSVPIEPPPVDVPATSDAREPATEPPPAPSDPYSSPDSSDADDASWSTWAAGGAAPAAADSTPLPPPADAAWTQQETAAIVPAAVAGTAVMVDPEAQVEEAPPGKSRARSLAEWGAVIVGAIVIALLVKTFLFQAFYIPSGSMEPTLSVNDRVLVNKLSYDLHDVNRGDIVVFKRPEEQAGNISDLIKRVVALPGETITFADGEVYINDREVSEPYLKEQGSTEPRDVESIPNCEGSIPFGCTVPEGRVFVMGDNRTDSQDSRIFGPIKESSIVGRAFLRIWPITKIGFL